MSYLKAEVLVNDTQRATIEVKKFYCRDALIPLVFQQLRTLTNHGDKLSADGKQEKLGFRVGLNEVKDYARTLDWEELMGDNHRFSPIASPYLLRFYVGRIRNGYKYDWMEQALRKAHLEGVSLEADLAVAWNLDTRFPLALGLNDIRPNNNAWNYVPNRLVDYARIFPPYKFIK